MGTIRTRRSGQGAALALSFALALLLSLFVAPCPAWQGKAIQIADGDTITVLGSDSRQVRIRLYGIDTPERGQDFGAKAKEFTAEMVGNKLVEVESFDQDRYGRTVALVRVDGKSLNEALLGAGLAWVYRRYCVAPFCSEWLEIESQAVERKLGLWAGGEPIPPWDFRTGRTVRQYVQGQSGAYHGNVTSRVFHSPACRYYHCAGCVQLFPTRDEALASGYTACGTCNP
jgi:micrococcal nuclease